MERGAIGGNRPAQPQAWRLDAENVVAEQMVRQYSQLMRHPISGKITTDLLDRVRDWSARGICVYGLRPPTCAAMEEVENDFDERQFVIAFENAGGRWLEPSKLGLISFDASHLDAPSAQRLSQRVAREIAASLPTSPDRLATQSAPGLR